MRKIFFIIATIAISTSAFAQIGVGAGYVDQTTKTTIKSNSSTRHSNGFRAGAEFTTHLGAGFSIAPSAYYMYLSSREEITGGHVDIAQNIISLPFNVQYHLPLWGDVDMFAFAGTRLNYTISSETSTQQPKIRTTVNNFDNQNLKRWEMGLGFGVGFDIIDMIRLKMGYDFGYTDMNEDNDIKVTNSGFNVSLAFLF
ncbi:MAG: porin family protein [Bacteroidales bacterium]|nr:porin family protein [Bacteroidales bacterium]MBQ5581791.1 porin family protein [Bacteroidales bacterium]